MLFESSIRHGIYRFMIIVCISIAVLIGLTNHITQTERWQVSAIDSTVTNYAPTLHALERSQALSDDIWFRHIRNNSIIAVPRSAHAQIVTLSLLLRSEHAPASLGIHTADHTLWIYQSPSEAPQTAQLRRIMWYSQPNAQYTIRCDNTHLIDRNIQPLCTAFVQSKGYRIDTRTVNALMWIILPYLSWMLLGIVSVGKLTSGIAHRTLALCSWAGVGLHMWAAYPLQIESWRSEISLICLLGLICIAILPQRRHTWVHVIFILAMLTRIGGYVVPGSPGTDRIIHAQQLENVLHGNLYQSNRGLIVINDITKQQPQVYPYPPAVYLGIAPVSILLDSHIPNTVLIGIIAILLEGILIIVLAHVMQRLRMPEYAIRISVIIGLCLPQAYVLHVYTTAAQSIGQTFAWMGVLLALVASSHDSRRHVIWSSLWAFLATASHIGVFITMSVVQGWAWLIQRGRIIPAFVGWIAGSGLVWVLFYSQYIGLITQQVDTLVRIDTPYWRDELYAIWHRGIDDHYSWIIVALMVLAWGVTSIQQRPALRMFYAASIMMVMTFIVLRVALQVNPTRFIIFVAPIVALGAGVILAHISRQRAGRILTHALIGYLAYMGLVQWYTLMITHQLLRWYTPQ